MGSLAMPSVTNVLDKHQYPNNTMDVGLIQQKPIGAVLRPTEDGPVIFKPLTIRGVTFQNRIFVAPMCMYSCQRMDGVMTDFHLGHYGNLALRGPGLIIIEASSVEPRGRLSPQDVGIWGPEHVEPLRRVVNLIHASGSKVGIQLAHGGRKAGTRPPYYMYEENNGQLSRDGGVVSREEGGFGDEIVAPSPLPWKEKIFTVPHELTIPEIQEIVQSFVTAAKRAVEAGVDVIEIHAAHGYLIHNFLSGNTNKRQDRYGGSMENRFRFLLEIIEAVRLVIPKDMPLFCRVSGTDYAGATNNILCEDPEGWDIYQVTELCRRATPLGIDLIDISSGANLPGKAGIFDKQPGFQVPLAAEVKKASIDGLLVGSVGSLENGPFAETVLKDGRADVILVGREFLRDPSLVHSMARDLGVKARWACQYSWMWSLV